MKKELIFVLGIFIIISCKEKRDGEQSTVLLSNFISITDNENKGINEILEFYAGRCEYSYGFAASTKDGKKKYFEIKMSESEALEERGNKIEMPASNIAYLFYKNLKEEKTNYDEIHVVIIFNDGEKITFEYSNQQLELVLNRMSFTNKIVDYIKNKRFDELKPFLNNEGFAKYDKDKVINNLKKVDPQFGLVLEFRPLGFRTYKAKNGIHIVHISGAIIRSIQNHAFSIDLNLDTDDEEIFLMQYKL